MGAPHTQPRDPGLQPERTSLSWTRTAAGLLLNAVLNLRAGFVSGSVPLTLLACTLMLAAAATFAFGRHRQRALTIACDMQPAPHAAALTVTAATLLAAATGLASITAMHMHS